MEKEKVKILHSMMSRTWNVIGNDIFQSEGKTTMTRDEVVDVVIDANYLEMYGSISNSKEEKHIIESFRKLSFEDQAAIAKEHFKHEVYV